MALGTCQGHLIVCVFLTPLDSFPMPLNRAPCRSRTFSPAPWLPQGRAAIRTSSWKSCGQTQYHWLPPPMNGPRGCRYGKQKFRP
ncbi:hypothetical protein LXA43DRAFT_757487 [Ganoderma leucocontextum]|nr:hypothetical protein LXA43DRAFT_757487 [Ganoderma leucocontextum]